MNSAVTLLGLAGVVFCSLAAGCTRPTGALMKGAIPCPSVPVSITPDASASSPSVPVQVQTLPSEQYVDVQLSKERPDYTIHLLYNGGKGEVNIQNIFMKVTLPDGQVIEQYMNDNKRQPRRGDEIIVKGTRGSDHV
ncbi:MAG TPA: hypothetical protein VHN82_04530, partial [Methanoregula sp.]|nr:hypothetical protein [Methanoregula sp.]